MARRPPVEPDLTAPARRRLAATGDAAVRHPALQSADLSAAGAERERQQANELGRRAGYKPPSIPPAPPAGGPPPESQAIKARRRPLSIKQIATGHDVLGGTAPRGRSTPSTTPAPSPRAPGASRKAGSGGAPLPPLLALKGRQAPAGKAAGGKGSVAQKLYGRGSVYLGTRRGQG